MHNILKDSALPSTDRKQESMYLNGHVSGYLGREHPTIHSTRKQVLEPVPQSKQPDALAEDLQQFDPSRLDDIEDYFRETECSLAGLPHASENQVSLENNL